MDAMGGILTKGLGAPACCGLVLTQFNLAKCCQYTIEVTPIENGGGGGSRPLAPGEIHNFYSPINQPNRLTPLVYLQPLNNVPSPVDKITITLSIKNQDPIKKEYYVPRYKSKVILNVSRVLTSSFGLISVSIHNIKNRLDERIRIIIDRLHNL